MVPLPVVKISKYCLCFVFSLPLGDLFKLDCLIMEKKIHKLVFLFLIVWIQIWIHKVSEWGSISG